MARTPDVIVVGAGHNGLVTACYLARAGLDVHVLERRGIVGGACVSEALWPGYRVSTTSYVTTLFDPRIVRDFDLARHGYHVYRQDPAFFQPFLDGRALLLRGDEAADCEEYRKFSERDARRLPEFHAAVGRLARLARSIAESVPPRIPSWRPRDALAVLRLARDVLRLSAADVARFVEIATAGIFDFIEPWFESDQVRAFYCSQGVIGAYGGIHTPGTAALLLHDFLGGVDGVQGVWGVVRGGMSGLSEALAAAARQRGATIRTDVAVARILAEGGRARGVVLEGGDELRAPLVVSNADPRRTFLALTPAEALPAEFREAIERYRSRGASFKVHLALGELPRFSAMPQRASDAAGPEHRGLIVLCPRPDYVEEAWDDAKRGDVSREPMVEACLHSVLDETAAPPGKHVMSCFVQYGALRLREGTWAQRKSEAAERVIRVLGRFAPNLPAAVEAWHVYSPEDLETEFGLTGANIFHGEMTPGQLFSFRPAAGCADYRTPLPGLYLCGAGAHPGGGVWGAAGRGAAREILRDLGRPEVGNVVTRVDT